MAFERFTKPLPNDPLLLERRCVSIRRLRTFDGTKLGGKPFKGSVRNSAPESGGYTVVESTDTVRLVQHNPLSEGQRHRQLAWREAAMTHRDHGDLLHPRSACFEIDPGPPN